MRKRYKATLTFEVEGEERKIEDFKTALLQALAYAPEVKTPQLTVVEIPVRS